MKFIETMANKFALNSQGVSENKKNFILPWSGRGIDYTKEDIDIVVDTTKLKTLVYKYVGELLATQFKDDNLK